MSNEFIVLNYSTATWSPKKLKVNTQSEAEYFKIKKFIIQNMGLECQSTLHWLLEEDLMNLNPTIFVADFVLHNSPINKWHSFLCTSNY